MKIGYIYHANGKGLEQESKEFLEHFKVEKVIMANGVDLIPTIEKYDRFLKDIDLFFCIETPYLWEAFKIAKERGIKTVLRVNYEWLPNPVPIMPDLLIAPSLWHWEDIPETKVYLPFPVNREKLSFKLRKRAKRFFHLGAQADYDRNGTEILREAIKQVKSDDVDIMIREAGQYQNYWDIWNENEADVFILPRRYAGQSLSLNEAMSKGMAVIATDMAPQNEFLPRELLVPAKIERKIMIKREIEVANVNPEDLAKKIDEIANKDITNFSKISDHIAKNWSWEKLKPKYNKLFDRIWRQKRSI